MPSWIKCRQGNYAKVEWLDRMLRGLAQCLGELIQAAKACAKTTCAMAQDCNEKMVSEATQNRCKARGVKSMCF
jgi:hypothetical protein